MRRGRGPHRDNLRVGRRVVAADGLVETAAQDLAVEHDKGAHGDLSGAEAPPGFVESGAHEGVVCVHRAFRHCRHPERCESPPGAYSGSK